MDQQKMILLFVVVAVAALGLAVYGVINAMSDPERGRKIDYHGYVCTESDCGYAFSLPAGSFGAIQSLRAGVSPDEPGLYCPKCHKRGVYKALFCRSCREWYLPKIFTDRTAPSSAKCPTCGGSPERWPTAEELPKHELKDVTGNGRSEGA
ncbi:MAG: hypothetical protein QF662_06785 [Phycisphaerae bacterium]|nr:hypothetical protein [Phycisphaerae bacterium]